MSLKFSGHGQNTGELYVRMSHELPLATFMIDFLFLPHETTVTGPPRSTFLLVSLSSSLSARIIHWTVLTEFKRFSNPNILSLPHSCQKPFLKAEEPHDPFSCRDDPTRVTNFCLAFFFCFYDKIHWQMQLEGENVYSCSQLGVAFHQYREVKTAETRNNRSYCIHNQETENNECLLTLYLLSLFYIVYYALVRKKSCP